MRKGVRYKICTSPYDSTFEDGDKVFYAKDGRLVLQSQSGGWLEKEDAEIALKGVKCLIDRKYYLEKRFQLASELAEIESILKEADGEYL